MKLPILICEAEALCTIKDKHTEQEIIDIFLQCNLKELYKHLAKYIVDSNLLDEHIYRFKIQVHAQEKEEDKCE